MTDPKRLPVYAIVRSDGFIAKASPNDWGMKAAIANMNGIEAARMNGFRYEITKYVPESSLDVPRCRTCDYFDPEHNYFTTICGHGSGVVSCPPNGSGYCHNHPEAKKERI
jgi:hypothetical protein